MKKFNKLMAALLALVMCLSLLPVAAFAEDLEDDAPIDVNGVFNEVVDKITDEFITPDQDDADRLLEGTYDALNPDAEPSEDKNIFGEDGKVKGDVLDQVDAANAAGEKLEADLNATVEGLDEKIAEKADEAETAKAAAEDAVEKAAEAMEGLQGLVNAGNADAVEIIAGTVAEQAAIANEAYEAAQMAYNEAETALNAAKAAYNQVIAAALAEAVEAGKIAEDALEDLGDEDKANMVIEWANDDLKAAQDALDTAQAALDALEETRKDAETAKVIAEKYQTIADQLAVNPESLTNANVIAILLGDKNWTAELDQLLEELDKTNLDDGDLADTSVDYALAQKNLDAAKQDQVDFNESEDAKAAAQTIDEINDAISGAQELITELKNAKVVAGTTSELNEQLELMSQLLTDLQNARKTLQNPDATEQEKQEAQEKQTAAMNKLFVNDGLGGGLLNKGMPLVSRFYTGTQGDGQSAWRWDFSSSENKEKAASLCALLMGATVKDSAGSVWEKETAVQESKYDLQLSAVVKAVNDAQTALDSVDLEGALNDYLTSIGNGGVTVDDAATKAAQLAAVLRGISDDAVNAAWEKAEKAAQAAAKAAEDLATAQAAYDAAVKALQDKTVGALTGLAMTDLFGNAQSRLEAAKIALDAAEKAKGDADKAKEEADKALEDAEENRRIIDAIIGGSAGADIDTDIEIDDVAVPLAAGPVTRAEFIDYLWRHEGEPASSGVCTFTDVAEDHEFVLALAWAEQNGIVTANEDGAFEPDELVTVAAVREILGNFARVYGMDVDVYTLVSLTGDEDEAVLNCDEVLAEFFGEDLAEQAA